MESTSFPTLSIVRATPKEFVLFWERFYSPDDEDFYRENIGQPLTEDRVSQWFQWKNGTLLSAKKKQSIRRYLGPDERIPDDANVEALEAFLNRPGGAIWRIFWLHIQHPSLFPIYDQHAHRAMAFLLKSPDAEIPIHGPKKVRTYLGTFCPFFKRFADCEHRVVDRALWTFGRFLSTKYRKLMD